MWSSVAGGELLIPTFILVFGADVATAGTASILVALVLVPTALWRYAQLGALPGRQAIRAIGVPLGAGSVLGGIAGGLMAGALAASILQLILGSVLIISAVKVFARRR